MPTRNNKNNINIKSKYSDLNKQNEEILIKLSASNLSTKTQKSIIKHQEEIKELITNNSSFKNKNNLSTKTQTFIKNHPDEMNEIIEKLKNLKFTTNSNENTKIKGINKKKNHSIIN